ncbi:MAG TPA: PEP-CTERM sorting domain-containing protein, partial [Thermoguttaceae bacterium]|nr:PEP-CTERM sorting domain-containing protein [Thermoguttaceae bacterium]
VSIGADGTLDTPNLQSFTYSSLTLGADQTFNHGVITDVDYSALHVREGASLVITGAESYTNTRTDHRANLTLLSADGQNSRLELPSMRTFTSSSYGNYNIFYYDVAATNDAVIDLSSVESIHGAGQDDWLRFWIDSGGEIKLPSLRSATGRVRFDVGSDGMLSLGDVAVTQTTHLNLTHANAHVTVAGSLYLDGASQLSMASGSMMEIEGALYYAYTDPGKLDTASAILHFNGSGIQFLEVGGEDMGVDGSLAGNFGIGRLLVGQEDQPTTVLPLDLFDSGNRTGGAHEALYLYGVGGLDGLELLGGSTLVLDGINVYSYDVDLGEMVYLNGLIPPGATKAAYAGGYVALPVPEPSSVVLLAVAALVGMFYHRRRRR